MDLDIFRCPFADQQVVLLSHVADDRLVKIVTRNLDRSRYNGTAKRDHGDICRTAADIHDHIAARPGNIDPRANRCSNRLLNNKHFPCTCCVCRIFNRTLLDLSHTARHTDRNPRLAVTAASHCLLDKILDHLFRHSIIRNHALPQRTHCNDIARRPSKHQSRFLADCFDFICVAVKCNHRRLLQDNSLALHIYQYTGCTQINSDICRCHYDILLSQIVAVIQKHASQKTAFHTKT